MSSVFVLILFHQPGSAGNEADPAAHDRESEVPLDDLSDMRGDVGIQTLRRFI
jgi:hypothetical protein